jgi:hypothetical protein
MQVMKKINFEHAYNKKRINKYWDYVFDYDSKWKFFNLNIKNKNGIWSSLQSTIEKIVDDGPITIEDIDDFLNANPDIELEIDFFVNELPEIFFFRSKNKMYCYAVDVINSEKNKKNKTLARFYFDINEFVNF